MHVQFERTWLYCKIAEYYYTICKTLISPDNKNVDSNQASFVDVLMARHAVFVLPQAG